MRESEGFREAGGTKEKKRKETSGQVQESSREEGHGRLRHALRRGAAGLLLAAALSLPALDAYAVTGTVTASTALVRSDASTSASVAGQVDRDYSFQIGESKQDSDGMTWYQVTLEDGTTGYIRSDLVSVTADDPAVAASEEAEEAAAAAAEAAAGSTEEAETQSTSSGPEVVDGYYIEKGEDGNYYIVNQAEGWRLQIRELTDMKDELAANNAQIEAAARRGRGWTILILIALVVVIIIDVIFYQALRRVTGESISRMIRRAVRRHRKKKRRRAAKKRQAQAQRGEADAGRRQPGRQVPDGRDRDTRTEGREGREDNGR